MQILIPRTDLAKPMLFSSLLFVVFFQIPQWIVRVPLTTEPLPFSEPKIVFHCADWVKDTLPSYDLDFVRNNPRCIGNPTVLASPKAAVESPQVLPNASWQSRVGAGLCNLEPTEVIMDSIRNLGFVYVRMEGVEGSLKPDLSWQDEVVYYSCTEMQQNGGIYARILRKWTASYQNLQKDTIQEILFARPSLSEFVFGANNGEIVPDGFDQIVTYQACSGDKILIQKENVTPFGLSYFSTDLKPRLAFIDEASINYGIKIQDQDFPTCGSRGLKILRSIFVFDSCQGQYVDTFLIIIKIGDYQGPKFIKTKELPEIHINSSDGKAKFGINRSELANRFGVQIEECFLGGMSAWVEILTAANEWQEVRGAATTSGVSLPVGHYRLHVFAGDACFNTAQDSFEFVVKNELGPIPICVNGLSVQTLLPDGQGGGTLMLKATDFVGGPIYDLNGQGPDTLGGKKLITHYSINRIGQTVDSNQRELKLTCADVGKVIIVELHAWDQNGHDGFCVTYVEVQNINRVCLDREISVPTVYGSIETPWYEGVQNVSVTLSGHNIFNTAKTVKNGGYSFINLTRGEAYWVTPKLVENPLNGVSTFDIVLIQKHILGIQILSSPYKMIAADVNSSGSISTLDLIQIRKLILGIDTRFSNNNSWRFVEANYTFPNPNNPWVEKFPESTFIRNMVSFFTANFVAIKIGDVNASAKLNEEE